MSAPNPKASAALLRVFSALSGVPLNLRELQNEARKMERNLVRHLEKLQAAAQGEATALNPAELAQAEPEVTSASSIAPEVLSRIENLFEEARSDRSKALELKRELDQSGLFRQYEDRFLDLFKQAG